MLNVGDIVTLNTPDNPRLLGTLARVEAITEWGAHVSAEAAATGAFRALFEEMQAVSPEAVRPVYVSGVRLATTTTRQTAREEGYTGDACDQCGSFRMKRNGPCLLCAECGATSGCS